MICLMRGPDLLLVCFDLCRFVLFRLFLFFCLVKVATKLDALQAEHAAATEKNDEAKLARIHKQGEQLTLR